MFRWIHDPPHRSAWVLGWSGSSRRHSSSRTCPFCRRRCPCLCEESCGSWWWNVSSQSHVCIHGFAQLWGSRWSLNDEQRMLHLLVCENPNGLFLWLNFKRIRIITKRNFIRQSLIYISNSTLDQKGHFITHENAIKTHLNFH